MDPYDAHRHHNHPSDSIPNAAYPDDSSYRPSDSAHELSNLMPASSAALQQHSHSSPGSTSPGGSRLTTSPWQPDPLGPPPPYDPSEAPSSFSQPQQQQQQPQSFSQSPSTFSQQPSSFSQPPSTFSQAPPSTYSQPPLSTFSQPPAAYSPLNAPSQAHTSSTTNLHLQTPPHSSGGYAPPSPYSTHSSQFPPPSPFAGPGKPGPVALARARRRRRRQLCLIIVAALVVFIIAVIIGIALGVLKVQSKNKDNDWDD